MLSKLRDILPSIVKNSDPEVLRETIENSPEGILIMTLIVILLIVLIAVLIMLFYTLFIAKEKFKLWGKEFGIISSLEEVEVNKFKTLMEEYLENQDSEISNDKFIITRTELQNKLQDLSTINLSGN